MESDPARLARIGTALYGHQWQTALARDLPAHNRTVQKWASGERSISATAWHRIRHVAMAKHTLVGEVVAELESAADAIKSYSGG